MLCIQIYIFEINIPLPSHKQLASVGTSYCIENICVRVINCLLLLHFTKSTLSGQL